MFLGVFAYSESLSSTYTAETVVAFTPKPPVTIGGDTMRIILPKYVAAVTSPSTEGVVANQVGLSTSAIDGALDASIPADTTNLEIKVSLGSARQAEDAAQAFGSAVLDAAQPDELLTAAIVSPATLPTSPSGPKRLLIDAV